MANRKHYNTVDIVHKLLYIEISGEKYGGYSKELLMSALTELECESYLCNKCKGIMRDASQFGEEQTPVCGPCADPRYNITPMVRSRKRIPTFYVKCPLATRGCDWNSTLAEVEMHLGVCEELIISCPNKCGLLMKRSDLELHTQVCELRNERCGCCQMEIKFKHMNLHYEECVQFPVQCPNGCEYELKRREVETHLQKECPNIVVECDYRKFGCMHKAKRSELKEHRSSNEIMHLELVTVLTVEKVKRIENRLQARLDEQEITITTLRQENTEIREILRLFAANQEKTDAIISGMTRRRTHSVGHQGLPPFFPEKHRDTK